MKNLILLGTGVFAEEMADLISEGTSHRLVGFAENRDPSRTKETLLELPIHWFEDLPRLEGAPEFLCSIGSTKRSQFTGPVEEMGLPWARFIHPSARLSATSTIGAGSLLSVSVVVAAHTTLGRHVIVNRGALIGHHTEIGDTVTISPGANIGGRVRIGSQCYIGMASVILNDITIGEGAIVGAGAVVTRDVPPHTQVLGVPARVTKTDVDPH